MAFRHKEVGTSLTEAEFDATTGAGAHIVASQARGDILISETGADGFIRLAKGTQGYILSMNANDPQWTILPPTNFFIMATDMQEPGTNGAPVGTEGDSEGEIGTRDFDATTEELADWVQYVPATYDGASITVTIFWIPASSSTIGDTVSWTLSGISMTNDDAASLSVEDKIAAINDIVTAAQDWHVISGTWSTNLPTVGEVLKMRIARNVAGTDDMTEDAKLVAVLIAFNEDVE